jgi:hypothetical protein
MGACLDLINRAAIEVAAGRRIEDDFVLLPKTLLPPAKEEAAVVVEAVVTLVGLIDSLFGFPMPPQTESLIEAMESLRSADLSLPLRPRVRAGQNYIKSTFRSYWEAGVAPALRKPAALRRVVADRMGLNRRGEVFDLSLAAIRRGFQVQRYGVSFFSPFAAAQVYNLFLGNKKSPVVWDCSGGFGARMLAFHALYPDGVYYVNEPAPLTASDIEGLAALTKGQSRIYRSGSELMEAGKGLPTKRVDLVFTSPPYFDKEKYFDEPGQCWRDYPSKDLWVKNYLIPTLSAARGSLKPNGAVVINISKELEETLLSAADEVGLPLSMRLSLPVAADHFSRKRGVRSKEEPILIFSSARRKVLLPRPLWQKEVDPRESEEELWVEVVPTRYAVSNRGRVTSAAQGPWREMKPTAMQSGYCSVGIREEQGGKARTTLLHQLVVLAFDGPPPTQEHVDVRHLDGDKRNNSLVNLAWGTRSENMLDVVNHRQGSKERPPKPRESPWYQGYTLDSYLVAAGLQFYAEGKLSIADLTRYWRCSRDVAANIVHGETRGHVPRPEGVSKRRGRRRSAARREEIMGLIAEGLSTEQINERLGEGLTHQAIYYYKTLLRRKAQPD